MIRPVESTGEFLLLRCQVCKTIFDGATHVSRGDPLTIKPDGTGPVNRDFICIHLRCPRCFEKKVFKLWLFER